MAKRKQTEGDPGRQCSPWGILRWLVRFLIRSVLFTVITLSIVCLIAWITYVNRTSIVNEALARYVNPFDVSMESIELWPLGEVTIKNLTLSPEGSQSEAELASVPEVHLTYDFRQLCDHQQLRSVRIYQPTITVDQNHIDALTGDQTSDTSAAFHLGAFDLFTEDLKLTEGNLVVDLPTFATVQTELEFHSERLTFTEEGLTESPLSLNLKNLRVAERGTLGDVSLSFYVSRDLKGFDFAEVSLETLSTEVTPDWIKAQEARDKAAASSSPDSAGLSQESNPVELIIRNLHVGDSSISITGFDGKDGLPSFPDIAFDTHFAGRNFRFSNGRWTSDAPVSLTLSNLTLGTGGAQLLAIDQLELSSESLESLIHNQTVEAAIVSGIDVLISDSSLERFRAECETSPAVDKSAEARALWTLQSLTLSDGNFLLRGANFGNNPAPEVEARFTATLSDLNFSGDGFTSEGDQNIELEQARIRAPGSDPEEAPLLSFAQGMLSGKWSDFNFDNTIQSVTLLQPSINLTDASLGTWLQPDLPSGETGPTNRPVYKIADLKVDGGKLVADSSFADGIVPKIHSDFSIETTPDEGEPFAYLLKLNDFVLRNHPVYYEPEGPLHPSSLGVDGKPQSGFTPVAEEELIKIREIEVHANASGVQRGHQIEKVIISGAFLRVSEGLKSISEVSPQDSGEPEDNSPETEAPLPQWLLSEIEITQSQVIFETLIPQIEGLQFAIETSLTDVPLSIDGLLAQDEVQKVELAGIEIKDPYNSFITVAFLPTIFVEFSLSGLAQQQIEKIDLINPALHVGQGLFWWIDYQRNFRAQNEGVSVGLEEGGPLTSEPPLPVPEPEETPLSKPDWVIKTINATAGKIIIAPTGVPIGMVPFPFNATTNMKDGQIDLKLTIPGEDYVYEFPGYKVNLYGLTGDVQFNVPVSQVDNNLVQTFTLRRAVWKDYEAEDLYLSVTFDSDGIYGSLGGNAYKGYVEGQFNFYLNDPGKWDAWLAGTDFSTGPLTQVIVPDNFLMEGGVSLKLISEGRDKTLGETSGEFSSTTPGWFDITKFDQILKELPPEWSNLQRELTKLGLIALKRFDYQQGAGSLYMNGREGDLRLRFAGDYGTRELNLHLHDQRNPEAETNGSGAAHDNSTPVPEAAARPVAAKSVRIEMTAPNTRTRQLSALATAMAGAAVLSSCMPTFDVDVNTPEPIKVDLSMDIHVYQHGGADKEKSEQQASYRATMDSRRDRMAEIQELKNNRFVGENHLGKLTLRNRPVGEYGDYVENTVEDENRDREFLMRHEAEDKGVALAKIREEQWRHWQRKSFPGEWIEVDAENGNGLEWQQKQAAGQ